MGGTPLHPPICVPVKKSLFQSEEGVLLLLVLDPTRTNNSFCSIDWISKNILSRRGFKSIKAGITKSAGQYLNSNQP